jgi:lipoprotein-releasing system permease protein
MNITRFIARRYLFSRKHISLISTLTGISIGGVTIGTALLIIILSVLNGLFDVVKGMLLSFDPDIKIESATANRMLLSDSLTTSLNTHPEIKSWSPYAEGRCMLLTTDQQANQVVMVKGVQAGQFQLVNPIGQHLVRGEMALGVQNKRPGAMLDELLMNNLQLDVDSEVILLSAAGMENALTQFSGPRAYRFDVRGTYSMRNIAPQSMLYVDLRAAQRLFRMRNQISGIDIKLQSTEKAEAVKSELQAQLGPQFSISTWYDLQKPLYDVMKMEKWGAYAILMIIVLVAVLNIVGSLTMIVIQKQRDIGILQSLGCTVDEIRKIFLKQGLYIGLIGCGVGGFLGLGISWLQQEFGLVQLANAESFIINAYPISIATTDVVLVLGLSLLLCVGAAWYPAQRASSVDPADAIRYE